MAPNHFRTEDRTGSYCPVSMQLDVFSYGADDGPTTLCTGCGEPEPTWTVMGDSEFDSQFLK